MFTVMSFCPTDLSNYIKWYWNDDSVSDEIVKYVLFKNAEVADWDIDNALQDTIDHVDDCNLRNFYRRFLISIKFDCAINYESARYYDPYISQVTDDWVTIVFLSAVTEIDESEPLLQRYHSAMKRTTLLSSPGGQELIPDGYIYINDKYVLDTIATTEDACTSKKTYGIYDLKEGKSIIPHVLEDVKVDMDNYRIHFQYQGFPFTMDLCHTLVSEKRISSKNNTINDFKIAQIEINQFPFEYKYIPICFCNDKDYLWSHDYNDNPDSEEDPMTLVPQINAMKELLRVIEQNYKTIWGEVIE